MIEWYVRIVAGAGVAGLVVFVAQATWIASRAWAREWKRIQAIEDDEHADCIQEWHRCDGGGWPEKATYQARIRESGRVFDREAWRD